MEVLRMFTSMDTDSLAFPCGILSLVVPEQKKGNLILLSKNILRQFNSEDLEGSDDGSSSWYTKLDNHLRASSPKKIMHLLVSNKNPKSAVTAGLIITSVLRIPFGENIHLCWRFLLQIWYHKKHSSAL